MIIHRGKRPERDFTIIQNALLRDTRLSFRARGVLCCILSYPEGARIDVERMAQAGAEGRDALRKSFCELEAAGYMLRVRVQDPRGRWMTETTVYDDPQVAEKPVDDLGWGSLASPMADEPMAGEPMAGNPPSVNPPSENPAVREKTDSQDYNNNNNHIAGASARGDGGETADEVVRAALEKAAQASAVRKARPKPEPKPKIEFTGTGFINITDEQMALWKTAYPAINLNDTLARAVVWLDANPENRKTDYKKFLVRWFSREQDRAPRVGAAAAGRRPPSPLPVHTSGVTKL